MVTLQDIQREAERLLGDAPAGEALDAASVELLAFAVRIAVTTLDTAGAQPHARRALAAGVSPAQLHEVVLLVSGLGVHSLFEGTRLVSRLAQSAVEQGTGNAAADAMRDPERQRLWDTWVGEDRYWQGFEREVPDFLAALLQASPPGFDAFFRYCAVPWKDAQLPALTKELISMAADATPTHRFLPGMRLHLRNALKLGAGRNAVMQTLDIAAAAPEHPGVA
jgi:alkylhydroperoxidase/carboxymuconolactone decarboxylase family protein YurZ